MGKIEKVQFEATIKEKKAFCFIGQIKKVTSKIDVVGDKVASMTIDFYATNENLREINAMQQPEKNVEITMKKSK
jgi:hypothetical protein